MKADSTSTSTAQQRARTGLCPCQLLEARDKDDDKIIQETKTHMQTREETMCKFVYRERERERERERVVLTSPNDFKFGKKQCMQIDVPVTQRNKAQDTSQLLLLQ